MFTLRSIPVYTSFLSFLYFPHTELLASESTTADTTEITAATDMTAESDTTATDITLEPPTDTTDPVFTSCSQLTQPAQKKACTDFNEFLSEDESYGQYQVVTDTANLKAAIESTSTSTVFILPSATYPITGTLNARHSIGFAGTLENGKYPVISLSATTESEMHSMLSLNMSDKQRSARIMSVAFQPSGDGSTVQLNAIINGGATEHIHNVALLNTSFSHSIIGHNLTQLINLSDVRGNTTIGSSVFSLSNLEETGIYVACKGDTVGEPCTGHVTFNKNRARAAEQTTLITVADIPVSDISQNTLQTDSNVRTLSSPLITLQYSNLRTAIYANIHNNQLNPAAESGTSVSIINPDPVSADQLNGDIYVYDNQLGTTGVDKADSLENVHVHTEAPEQPTEHTLSPATQKKHGLSPGGKAGISAAVLIPAGAWVLGLSYCTYLYASAKEVHPAWRVITVGTCMATVTWKIAGFPPFNRIHKTGYTPF